MPAKTGPFDLQDFLPGHFPLFATKQTPLLASVRSEQQLPVRLRLTWRLRLLSGTCCEWPSLQRISPPQFVDHAEVLSMMVDADVGGIDRNNQEDLTNFRSEAVSVSWSFRPLTGLTTLFASKGTFATCSSNVVRGIPSRA